jgi:hypothetical protein
MFTGSSGSAGVMLAVTVKAVPATTELGNGAKLTAVMGLVHFTRTVCTLENALQLEAVNVTT